MLLDLTMTELISIIHSVINDVMTHSNPQTTNGICKPGTYDPKANTVTVLVGDTGADDFTATEGPLYLEHIPLMSPGIGHAFAPIGGETIELHHTPGGYVGHFRHYSEDALQSPQSNIGLGEHWINLRSNQTDKVAKTYMKVGNDATRLGHPDQVSLVTPLVTLGNDKVNNRDGNSVVRKSDLQNAINTTIANVFSAMAQSFSHCMGGQGVPAAQIQGVTATGSNTSYTE